MKWGKPYGKKWGLQPEDNYIPQDVEVVIVKGQYVPCHICRWVHSCIVPRDKHNYFYTHKRQFVFDCHDFVGNKTHGISIFGSKGN